MTLIDTLTELLRIRSYTGDEGELCDLVEREVRARSANSIPLVRRGNALIAWTPHRPGRKRVVFAGHLDTVKGDEWGERVRLEGDRVVGLGASDMKGGLAVMLELIDPAVVEASRFNLGWIFYDREEGPAAENGIMAVLEALPGEADLCFVLEPTDDTLHLGCMGVLHARVIFHGVRAHSARPWQGENAIHKSAGLLTALARRTPRIETIEGLNFAEVFVATMARESENSRNVVPDRFELNLNMRFVPGMTAAEAEARLRSFVRDAGGDAEVEIVDRAPSCPVPERHVILEEFRTRYHLEEHPKQAYTDVARFAERGIPAVNCGPGLTAQAHQRGEFVLIEHLVRSLARYRDFLIGGAEETR